jgi:hypothetical protein
MRSQVAQSPVSGALHREDISKDHVMADARPEAKRHIFTVGLAVCTVALVAAVRVMANPPGLCHFVPVCR